MRSFCHKAIFLCATALITTLAPFSVSADTLFISPATGSYAPGKTFSVSVYVSSNAQAINAVSGTLSFPQDKLQAVSVSKTNSVLTLWVQEPAISNAAGTVTFEGVVPNPGFVGSSGRVVTVTFRVVGQGDASLRFESGSVLANDGNGTNILRTLGTASFSLGSSPVPAELPDDPAPASSSADPRAPGVPKVSSATYPESSLWYTEKNGRFSWDVGTDVTGTRLLLGKMPNSVPTVVYDPPIDKKDIPDIEDGAWYLHVQHRNSYGWGPVAHYLFRVDATKPETFTLRELARGDQTEPRVRFSMNATDSTSGISYFMVTLDGGKEEKWQDDGSGIYEAVPLGPGKHTLVARAYDAAGNFSVSSVDFYIQPIESPTIESYTEEVTDTSTLEVSGTARPLVTVLVSVKKGEDKAVTEEVKADANGSWEAVFGEALPRGVYKLSAIARDSRGATSEPSEVQTVVVKTSWLISLGSSVVKVLAILVPIVALIFALVFVVLYFLNKLRRMKSGVHKELRDVEHIIDRAFDLFKEDIEDSVRILERAKSRRTLTREEDAIIKRFRQNLDEAERIIRKEVRDVEREVDK